MVPFDNSVFWLPLREVAPHQRRAACVRKKRPRLGLRLYPGYQVEGETVNVGQRCMQASPT